MFRFTSREPITRSTLNFNQILSDLTQDTPTTDATIESASALKDKLDTLLAALDKNANATSSSINEENKAQSTNNHDKQETSLMSDHNISETAQTIAHQLHSLHNNLLQQTQKARSELATVLDSRKVDADALLGELTRSSHC